MKDLNTNVVMTSYIAVTKCWPTPYVKTKGRRTDAKNVGINHRTVRAVTKKRRETGVQSIPLLVQQRVL